MKFEPLFNWLLTLLLCLVVNGLFGQQTLTGVVQDENGDPLIGANVMIKGTDRGTTTDFDGAYSIRCSPGETLMIEYVGYPTTETLLTERSFRRGNKKNTIRQKEVKVVTSSAYQNAIRKGRDTSKIVATPLDKFSLIRRIYNYQKIKDINFEDAHVLFDFADDPWKYQIGLSQEMAFSFIPDQRLPSLQTKYAGGTNEAGVVNLLSSDAEFPQAFGPDFSNLAYDGIPTVVNPQGQLIFSSVGNGVVARDSRPNIFPGVFLSSTGLNLKFFRKKEKILLYLKNQTGKDIFGVRPYRTNRISMDFIKRFNNSKLTLKGALRN